MDEASARARTADPTALRVESLLSWTQVIYALHPFSLLAFIGAVIASSFAALAFTGWPSIIAVILTYVKRSQARGTWLESHFRWQIRTFWYGLLWLSLWQFFGLGVILPLTTGAPYDAKATIRLISGWPLLGLVQLWFIYRIVRGWLALLDRRPMYVAGLAPGGPGPHDVANAKTR